MVADAGPIITAARAGRLALLRLVFGQLVIPPAVLEEIVVKGAGKPGSEPGALAGWVEARGLSLPHAALALPVSLGPGEREAVVLALELGATLLADGAGARAEAASRRIPVVGTLTVLREAKSKGLVEHVRPVLDEYVAMGYRIGRDAYTRFLEGIGESAG